MKKMEPERSTEDSAFLSDLFACQSCHVIETLLIPFCFTFVYFRFPSNGDIKGFAFAMNSFRG